MNSNDRSNNNTFRVLNIDLGSPQSNQGGRVTSGRSDLSRYLLGGGAADYMSDDDFDTPVQEGRIQEDDYNADGDGNRKRHSGDDKKRG
mmetsp:Transcript_2420/g.5337  ORF Transcript_2420/g.5337 Transcript_2420/m.5337 type:complete len:89 (-) Transcript_2420:167-433(-)